MPQSSLPLARCEGVEIFASGVFRGKSYSVEDLEQIAKNFNELGPNGKALLRVPVVLGHEESQSFLEKTDLPAAAWPDKVWVRKYHDKNTNQTEAILLADFAEVPPVIAKLINTRAYRKVSPEIYDDFTDDFGNSHGKALRRISLLGGEIPQVKRIADIPFARFNERRNATHSLLSSLANRKQHPCVLKPFSGKQANQTYIAFAEVAPMDRAGMIQQVLAAMPTLPQTVVDTLTDEQLSAMVAALPAPSTPADAPMAMADLPREDMIADLVAAGQDPAALEAMPDEELKALYDQLTGVSADASVAAMADMTREEMIATLTAQGQDPAALSAMTDDELKAMLGQEASEPAEAPMSEIGKPAVTPTIPQRANQMATTQTAPVRPTPKKVTLNYAEQRTQRTVAKLDLLDRQIAERERKLKAADLAAKKQAVELFCEKLVNEGRIRPVDKPAYVASLMQCDDKTVRKFSDGKHATELEHKQAEYASLSPVIHFGEKIKNTSIGDATTEANKMRRFAERVDGLTPKVREQMVSTFSEFKKRNPSVSAEEYARKKLGLPEHVVA